MIGRKGHKPDWEKPMKDVCVCVYVSEVLTEQRGGAGGLV